MWPSKRLEKEDCAIVGGHRLTQVGLELPSDFYPGWAGFYSKIVYVSYSVDILLKILVIFVVVFKPNFSLENNRLFLKGMK